MMQSGRQFPQYPFHETRGFSHFVESHGDPRGDIALHAYRFLGRQVAIRVAWQIAAQIKRLAASSPCKPGQTQFRGQGRPTNRSRSPACSS
jgi:hypothetical protein